MSLYKVKEIWYAYVTANNGRRIRRSTGTADRTKAQEIHDRLKADLWKAKQSGHTLNDALKLWLKASPRSVNEKNDIKLFLRLYPSRPLENIDGHAINDALASKSPAHSNRITNNIRAAINLAVQRKLCEPIPIPRRKIPKGKGSRTRWLSREEWQTLEAELPPHLKAMARFAISTGLRQHNVFNLKWDSVDLRKKIAWVDAPDAKGGKTIPVPLSDYAIDILKAKKGEHAVFVFTYREKPVKSVKTAWKKALRRAGIEEEFTWHGLRHTWASWHILNGTPLAVLKELGGWSSLDMVLRYAHLAPDHISQYAKNATA